MRAIIFSIILLCYSYEVFAQINLADSVTNEPVVGATVYSDKGLFIGMSDEKGKIDIDSLKKVDISQVTIQHVAYENMTLSYEAFTMSNRIVLTQRNIEIKEIVVTDRSQDDYVVLKGYFRVHDLMNDKSRYLYDGLIAFYIPLKGKDRIRFQLLEYRLFANEESLAEANKLFGKLLSERPQLPTFSRESVVRHLPKGNSLIAEGDKRVIKGDGLNLGFVQHTKSGNTQVYFDRVPPQSVIKRKLFRIRGEQYRGLTIENYSHTDLDNPAIENLISRVTSHVGAVQRKKAYGYVPMESFSEFYVTERSYLSEEEVKDLEGSFTRSIYLEEKSKYTKAFWEDLKGYNIPPLAEGVRKQLGNELKEY
ncbi:hypothetical protein ORI89_16255 [Sphingobacterium sp. UT-1RO-CII-1]|uniref:hypothetical protein n=1 Tax=Sphingobacterium sp. UT-1RO-CII-1 TaxID=2995225 RepID=UPI00227A98DD|nr:hypothetical protein [Sphingobacterium sp. UT-1RO-CII-1]MCY4781216.1 hypothetical protein [Sphingobacterium sp. UT-1RO-CII-1]